MSAAPTARDRLLGALLVVAATAAFALITGEAFRPRPGFVGDFTQDWLSAREVLSGRPAYGDLPGALRRHFGAEPPADFLPWNAHPPGSVLLVLPFAQLSHHRAFFAWNLVTFPLFVVAVWLVAAELGPWRGGRAAGVAAGVAVLGVTCYPLHQQVVLGQFNALLAFLIAVAWVADRHDRWALAGLAVGAAVAVKLFPALLLVYLVAAQRWRAAGVALLTAGALTGAAVAVLGADAFVTYARDVVPAVSAKYATQWNNLSISAFWGRLFTPTPESRVVAVADAPLLGALLAGACRLAMWGATVVAALGARSSEARDRAFALVVVAMVLVSPIAWPHYFVLLVVPIGLLLAGLGRTRRRWPLLACLVVLWLPDTFVPALALGREFAERMSVHRHDPLTPERTLLVASVPFYAVLGLFLLLACRPVPDTGRR
ncbi:MAG TPA: glycosyltransferase family 87 protein [Gemmata sp.]